MILDNLTLRFTPLPVKQSIPVLSRYTFKKAIYITGVHNDNQIFIPIVLKSFYTPKEFENGSLFEETLTEDQIDELVYLEKTNSWIFNINSAKSYNSDKSEECTFCSVITQTRTKTLKQKFIGVNSRVNVEESTWDEKKESMWTESVDIPICSYCLSELEEKIYDKLNTDADFQRKYIVSQL